MTAHTFLAAPGIAFNWTAQPTAHQPRTDALTPEQREFMQRHYAGAWVRPTPNAMMPGMDVPSALARLSLVGMQRGNVSEADAVKTSR